MSTAWRRLALLVSLPVGSAVLVQASAHAGGVLAGEVGAAGQQRAGAFVAKADDGSALAVNPAGLMKLPGFQLYLAANVIGTHVDFDAAGTYAPFTNNPDDEEPAFVGQQRPAVSSGSGPATIPLFTASYGTPRWAAALGVFAPQGNPNRDFPETLRVAGVDAPAPQRYDIVKLDVLVLQPSLGFAYRILDNLDVGARVSWGFAAVGARTAVWGVNKSTAYEHLDNAGYDAIFDVEVQDNFAPSFGLGALWRPLPTLEVGVSYSSAQKYKLTGTGTAEIGDALDVGEFETVVLPPEDQFALCNPGGTPGALQSCVELTVPQFASVGARWIFVDGGRGGELADVELDVRWENWAAAAELPVIVDGDVAQGDIRLSNLERFVLKHGFNDVFSVRAGGQYRFPVGGLLLSTRGGVSYDTAAAPDSWTRVDLDGSSRLQFAAGAALDGERWRVELGGAVIVSPERSVPEASLTQPKPVADRDQPDAPLPTSDTGNQPYYPINAGTVSSGYWIVSLGVSYRL